MANTKLLRVSYRISNCYQQNIKCNHKNHSNNKKILLENIHEYLVPCKNIYNTNVPSLFSLQMMLKMIGCFLSDENGPITHLSLRISKTAFYAFICVIHCIFNLRFNTVTTSQLMLCMMYTIKLHRKKYSMLMFLLSSSYIFLYSADELFKDFHEKKSPCIQIVLFMLYARNLLNILLYTWLIDGQEKRERI